MDRKTLIGQVKQEYAGLAFRENQSHVTQSDARISPDQYYETLLHSVLHEIEAGTFDAFPSGKAVVEEVAKNKEKWLPQWNLMQ